MSRCKAIFLLFLFLSRPVLAKTYELEIKNQDVFITGKAIKAVTVNGTIPAPTLYFQEGEEVEIRVKNSLSEPTSLHWHGFLLPPEMDGVPGLNGFHGISPGETFTYHFKIRQSGTYWYHAHSNFQEQQGLYGAIVIKPRKAPISEENDAVILLSDFSEENPDKILNHLKSDSSYYNYNRRTVFTFFDNVKKDGFLHTFKDRVMWRKMRMDPTDLADVSKYHFLINGQTAEKSWSKIFTPNKPLRLRFVNAAAMTFFDVSIPGLKMKVVAADGQNVKPFTVDEFRIGNAETYDVIVTPQKNQSYAIFAEALDRSGYALGRLLAKEGDEIKIPKMRKRTILTMADMKMSDDENEEEDINYMHHHETMKSGWADAYTPPGHKALSYADLISATPQKDLRKPVREIEFHFGGNMYRYIWTINGEKFPKPVSLKFGERVRLKFINDTMMAHPIHLHGMFMQLENGQKMNYLPNKHTIIVPPAQTISTLLTANEAGEWAFHCHLLFHMASGMMTNLTIEKK